MKKLFASIQNYLQKGESLVLVTVTASRGSVPRGAGARMMVSKEGYVYGSIGGGI